MNTKPASKPLSKPILAALLAGTIAAPSAFAHAVVYETQLSGLNELPSVVTPGTGKAIVTLNEHDMTLRVQADFSGLEGPTTAAHIHCCTTLPDAGNTGVAVPMPGFPSGQSGSYDRTFDLSKASSWSSAFINMNGGTVQGAFNALSQGLIDQKAYFNVHTDAFAAGEVRGTMMSAVPEPGTLSLMLMGLLPMAGLLRRRAA